MNKVSVNDFIDAKGTVKGRLHLFYTAFVLALASILTICAQKKTGFYLSFFRGDPAGNRTRD